MFKALVIALMLLSVNTALAGERARELRCETLIEEHDYFQEHYDRKDEMDYCDEYEDSEHCELFRAFGCVDFVG